ncbi:MAG: oxidoreductase [Ferruginibacter sp.]
MLTVKYFGKTIAFKKAIITTLVKAAICLVFWLFPGMTFSQQITLLNSGTKASFRGLSVVTDDIVWVSGSNGTVGHSTNAGKTWQWQTVKGFEKTEFRDIEAFDSNTAIIMAIAEPAYILRTTDGGKNWETVYENKDKGMFLDAMDFYDNQNGIVVGDPVQNKIFIARTGDGGKTWAASSNSISPPADSGEACFASSGTNIRMTGKNDFVMITGGLSSHLIKTNGRKIKLPLLQGKESTGANSIAVHKKKLMIVGGDFNTKDSTYGNFLFSKNGGKKFRTALNAPTGYRSCIEYLYKNTWITCGLNGVDITNDDGHSFRKISTDGYHVVRKAKTGTRVYLAGGGGRVAIVE